ncbi:hypothetical protein R1sor_005488 [Riccia sorocarpa]|uniref:AAA+ ATPase domain-containing protein n=1 Tax=Riccia sorocarpa TaxID=122646 RepID=A0ABD3HMQ0_9MARC
MAGEQSLWTVAADVVVDTRFQRGIETVMAAYFFYLTMTHMRCLLLSRDVVKEIKDPNQISRKKELLDSLLAVTRSREVESEPRIVDENDVLVNVGDENETDLHNPLILKRADQKSKKKCKKEADRPKTVTVTIQFSESLCEPEVERLVGELGKFFVAPAVFDGEEDGGFLRWLLPARAVQGRVQLGESTLSQVENIHKIASGIGKGCAVQLESWGVLLEEGHWQLDLLQETPLPVIFHSEYAAGILAICGNGLQGAKIYVTDGKNSIMFQDFQIQKETFSKENRRKCMGLKYFEAQIVEIPVRLSANDLEKVIVYASRAREIAAQSVVMHSTAVQIQDALWYTVIKRWIVGNLLLVFTIAQVTTGLHQIFTWALMDWRYSSYLVAFCYFMILPALAPFFSRLLRLSCFEYVRILGTVYFGISDLIKREPHFSTQVRSKQLSSKSRGSSLPTSKPPSGTSSEVLFLFPVDAERSSSVKSCVSSILKKEKSNNTGISKEWEPCIVENVMYMGLSTVRKMEKDEDDIDPDDNPFVIIYKKDNEKQLPWPEELRFEVSSQHLVKILKKHLTFQENVFCNERPEVPGRDIFVHIDSLSIEDAGIKEEHLSKAQLHLDLLVKHVKKEYKDVSPRLKRMKEEKLVSFDMLWAFLHRGQRVVYKCEYTNASLCAKVSEKVQYKRKGKRCMALVLLKVYYYNGQKYVSFNIAREIVEFGGERVFETLPVCPIGMMSKWEHVLEAEFIQHGRKYYEIVIQQSYRYMNYQGAMHRVKSRHRSGPYASGQVNADGRVMIDTHSFFSTNPGFKMFQEDPRTRKFGGPSEFDDQSQDFDSSVAPKELSDKKLMLAPGVVLGFSFALRQWGIFSVGGFSEVLYDATAFNELVMDQDDKSLIHSLVSQYTADPQQKMVTIDPISKKGEGCVILCYGPPGTGKTLTAESLAENLGRPLWALSLSQFGTDPEKLESSLSTVLNTASLWQAILLLDEADIFLEKRTNNMDLARNAMIGVFLRQLEYYRGIMFLTTNRVSAFDDAVRSRVSMLVCYRQFTVAERAQIWKTLLGRAGMDDVAELDELSSLDLNGREIRNVVHAAQVWARSNSSALEMEHVKYVVDVFTRSIGTLQQVVRESLGA